MGLGSMMAGGNPDPIRGREKDDFYGTPKDATRALCDVLEIGPGHMIWEPSCGEGAISNVLIGRGATVISTDLVDRGYGDSFGDFLEYTEMPEGYDTIITNPPYGKFPALFINHAWNVLKVKKMALLLKSTYFQAKDRELIWYNARPCAALALTWRLDFMGLGAPTMENTWFIWDRDAPPNTTLYNRLDNPSAVAPKEKKAVRKKRVAK